MVVTFADDGLMIVTVEPSHVARVEAQVKATAPVPYATSSQRVSSDGQRRS